MPPKKDSRAAEVAKRPRGRPSMAASSAAAKGPASRRTLSSRSLKTEKAVSRTAAEPGKSSKAAIKPTRRSVAESPAKSAEKSAKPITASPATKPKPAEKASKSLKRRGRSSRNRGAEEKTPKEKVPKEKAPKEKALKEKTSKIAKTPEAFKETDLESPRKRRSAQKSPQKAAHVEKKRAPPASPRPARISPPSSLRFHFLAKEIVGSALKENRTPPAAVVLERSHYRPATEHRQRQKWTAEEQERLRRGVERHGEGAWAQIWNDATLGFRNGRRTQVDLKDKWRNCTAYRTYSQNPIRRFILVDAQHRPVLTPAGQFHVYNNRWPRDAAMKAATKDEMYPVHPATGAPVSETQIYLRELLASDSSARNSSMDPTLSVVHVYRGTRQRERPPTGVPKFANARQMWVARVEKVAEELYIVPQ